MSTVGEIGESSPCNEDGVSHEASPTCGPDGGVTPSSGPDGGVTPSSDPDGGVTPSSDSDGGVTPSSDPDGETSSCGEASFRGVHVVSQSGATNELSRMNNWNFLRNAYKKDMTFLLMQTMFAGSRCTTLKHCPLIATHLLQPVMILSLL